jgi:hypothetical protein
VEGLRPKYKKIGSSGRTRTSNSPVKSRPNSVYKNFRLLIHATQFLYTQYLVLDRFFLMFRHDQPYYTLIHSQKCLQMCPFFKAIWVTPGEGLRRKTTSAGLVFGPKRIKSLSHSDVENFRNERLNTPIFKDKEKDKEGRERSIASVNRERGRRSSVGASRRSS